MISFFINYEKGIMISVNLWHFSNLVLNAFYPMTEATENIAQVVYVDTLLL